MANVLIIGSGGREHALGWKLAQSPEVEKVFYLPGNGGTSHEDKAENIPIYARRKDEFIIVPHIIEDYNINLTVVGPEEPLAEGIVDFLYEKGHKEVIGPTAAAARLEADKFFSFELMRDLGIPQARSVTCHNPKEALKAVEEMRSLDGVVIKARGLMAGKGVKVCYSQKQALDEINNRWNQYGPEILVAERLTGEEFSVFGISDGEKVVPLDISLQDYKRLNDGNEGPNTGGMGAYGPAPVADADTVRKVAREIMNPVVTEMKNRGTKYRGFLYAGMMKTKKGLKVIEFNARFGDPECQPMMVLLKSDLYQILRLSLQEELTERDIEFYHKSACCVVLASPGYPRNYERGLHIDGLEEVAQSSDVKVFHSGTRKEGDRVISDRGRVLSVTACLEDLAKARELAYDAARKITIHGGFHYRKDIAAKV